MAKKPVKSKKSSKAKTATSPKNYADVFATKGIAWTDDYEGIGVMLRGGVRQITPEEGMANVKPKGNWFYPWAMERGKINLDLSRRRNMRVSTRFDPQYVEELRSKIFHTHHRCVRLFVYFDDDEGEWLTLGGLHRLASFKDEFDDYEMIGVYVVHLDDMALIEPLGYVLNEVHGKGNKQEEGLQIARTWMLQHAIEDVDAVAKIFAIPPSRLRAFVRRTKINKILRKKGMSDAPFTNEFKDILYNYLGQVDVLRAFAQFVSTYQPSTQEVRDIHERFGKMKTSSERIRYLRREGDERLRLRSIEEKKLAAAAEHGGLDEKQKKTEELRINRFNKWFADLQRVAGKLPDIEKMTSIGAIIFYIDAELYAKARPSLARIEAMIRVCDKKFHVQE